MEREMSRRFGTASVVLQVRNKVSPESVKFGIN